MVYSVSELNRAVKTVIERQEDLQNLLVQGEITNFKRHVSGHLYFSIKDDTAQLRCVMFQSRARLLPFHPEDGQNVLIGGRVSLFEQQGIYQLYAEHMEPVGVGTAYLRFLELKGRLEQEGLFAQDKKRPLPLLPRRIGVITSLTGAAVRDIITVSRRRHPRLGIIVLPVLVQGASAAREIVQALQVMGRSRAVDVIILGRGGGGAEDLAAFNDEALVRAVAACPVPVVAAVGHETDFTLVDFAADRRAATPSAAAEIVVPLVSDLVLREQALLLRLRGALLGRAGRARERLRSLRDRPVLRYPRRMIDARRERALLLQRALAASTAQHVQRSARRLTAAASKLDALSPLRALGRGYAILEKDGRPVRSIAEIARGDLVTARLSDGNASLQVKEARSGDV